MSPGEYALAFHTSQGKFKQMLEDDSFFDVTVEDVEKLVGLMERGGCSRDEIVRIPKKCFVFLRDKEKEFMVRLGLNYDDHSITKKGPVFLLNGYTESQWRVLVDDDYIGSPRWMTELDALPKDSSFEAQKKDLYEERKALRSVVDKMNDRINPSLRI